MKYDKKLNTKQIYQNFLPLSYDLMDEIYENLQKENAGEFKKIIKMQKEAYITSVNKKENKQGESELSSIFNVMIDGEISKKNCELICRRNELAKELESAFKQNPKIAEYLSSNDVFLFCQKYLNEINKIVNDLFINKSFKEIVSLALNYAQFTAIYGFDTELAKKKHKEKNLTNFEKELLQSNVMYIVEAMNYLLEIGQSPYLTIFGGRTVCTGFATMTAGIIDKAFKVNNINAKAVAVSNGEHAFVEINYKNQKYVIDPTQYSGSFKEIRECDLENAKSIKGAVPLKLKKYDSDSHFIVVNYFLNKLKLADYLNKYIPQTDFVRVKIAKILAHIECNLSKMSTLIYPKAVFVDNREIAVNFYFELCLNACNIMYKTGCGTEDFIVYDNKKEYCIDLSKAFNGQNKLKNADKFLWIIDEKDKIKRDKKNNCIEQELNK